MTTKDLNTRNIFVSTTFLAETTFTGRTLERAKRSTMRTYNTLFTTNEARAADLPLVGRFLVTGATWEISTNSPDILSVMENISQLDHDRFLAPDLTLFFYVDFELSDRGARCRPYFRALEHLYYGTYGPGDSMLVDQRNRRVVGSVCAATARDVNYWKRVILPCLVGITSACVGITPLHCACVVKDQFGLLIHGESGAGKSTLALSLSLSGFSYLADDCTYVSTSKNQLQCWGSSAPLKLVPDAVTYFPQLAGLALGESLNGELSYEIDPATVFGVRSAWKCDPRWIIFIERGHRSNPTFHKISSAEAADRLASDLEHLPLCVADQRDHQLAVIDNLAQHGGWILQHDLRPEALALAISQFCNNN